MYLSTFAYICSCLPSNRVSLDLNYCLHDFFFIWLGLVAFVLRAVLLLSFFVPVLHFVILSVCIILSFSQDRYFPMVVLFGFGMFYFMLDISFLFVYYFTKHALWDCPYMMSHKFFIKTPSTSHFFTKVLAPPLKWHHKLLTSQLQNCHWWKIIIMLLIDWWFTSSLVQLPNVCKNYR